MSEGPVAALADADERVRERRAAVEEVGEETLRTLAEAHADLTTLLDRYEEPATGTGDFEEFIQFQGAVATLVEDLPDDLSERAAFEEVSELLHKRQLRTTHFDRARGLLAPVADLAARLDRREEALERYREARRAVAARRDELRARVDRLQSLLDYEDVDFDAPVERLRGPVEAYDEAVADAFATFRAEASARVVLSWAETVAADYPLVPVVAPPDELLDYLREHPAREETVPTLVEYADYSRSKLAHYVDDPGRFAATVGGNRTYLARLDADPLTVSFPPPPADRLRYRCEELVSAVGRFDDGAAVAACREVRDLARRDDYDRLRRAAVARDRLDAEERERLQSGAVREDLREVREDLARVRDALREYPER
ncbi:MAG: hypothetical protein ABEJ30_05340 [Halorientalis sp.]